MGENVGEDRPWTVAVVCGASGVGKSSVARPLAVRYGVPLGEVDDLVTALKALVLPADMPALHRWDTDPGIRSMSPDDIAELHLQVADELVPGIRAVIADHLEFDAPVVLEGDYLVPELVSEFGDAVRGVLLHEPDTDQNAANMLARESSPDGHAFRARVNAEIGRRLANRARWAGVPVLAPRPWADGLDRVIDVLAR